MAKLYKEISNFICKWKPVLKQITPSDVSAVILYSLIIFCVDSMIYDQHYFTWKNYGSVADVLQLMKTTYLWTETVFLLSEKTS